MPNMDHFMPKDTRTIANTSREEIAEILEKAEARKAKAWQKPRMCEQPECKKLFTPSREWQKYCGPRCQTAVAILKAREKDQENIRTIGQLACQVERLEAEVAALRAENEQLKRNQ